MEFSWIPPNPDDYSALTDPTLFGLLARQISSNDPMTFTEISDVEQNVKENNNIAWKNITLQNNVALPIELSYFSGERVRREIQLSWQTNSEIQNKGFEIFRSVKIYVFHMVDTIGIYPKNRQIISKSLRKYKIS